MNDEADRANDQAQQMTDAKIADVRRKASLPPGAPGECDLCGEWSGRLVKGVCAPCHDRRKLP